jgi:fermentation-respiration switch protein FrsA (DUF1100 family)
MLIWRVGMTTLSVVLVAVAALWFGQRWLIYFPDSQPPPPHTLGLREAEEVLIHTEDDLTLHAWFVPPAAPPTGQTIVLFGGNAGHRGLRAPLAEALVAQGLSVLLFDYRGYGGNPGLPSERGIQRDVLAAHAYLATRSDVDPMKLIYFGESLGAAAAIRLAVEQPPAGLILRSPFTALAEIGQLHYPFLPVRWMLRDRFASIALIDQVRSPTLFVAGTRDRIVPIENTEALYDAALEPKWMVTIDGADHNDEALAAGPELVAAVTRFLASIRQ